MRQLLTAGGHRFPFGFRWFALEGVQTTIQHARIFKFERSGGACPSVQSLNKPFFFLAAVRHSRTGLLSSDDPSNPPVPSVPSPQENATLAEKPARPRAPSRAEETPNKARAPTGRKKTPRKPAAAAHTNGTGTYKDARARRRSTRGDGVGDGAPREACRERGDRGSIVADGCRFFGPRARARARRRALRWQWPFFVPAQSAGAACTQCRCWRPPSAGLPPNLRRRRDDVQHKKAQSLAEVQRWYRAKSSKPRYSATIHRRRPPDAYADRQQK